MQAAWVYNWIDTQAGINREKFTVKFCEFTHIDHSLIRITQGSETIFCDPYAFTCCKECDLQRHMQFLLDTNSVFTQNSLFLSNKGPTAFDYSIFSQQSPTALSDKLRI